MKKLAGVKNLDSKEAGFRVPKNKLQKAADEYVAARDSIAELVAEQKIRRDILLAAARREDDGKLTLGRHFIIFSTYESSSFDREEATKVLGEKVLAPFVTTKTVEKLEVK